MVAFYVFSSLNFLEKTLRDEDLFSPGTLVEQWRQARPIWTIIIGQLDIPQRMSNAITH